MKKNIAWILIVLVIFGIWVAINLFDQNESSHEQKAKLIVAINAGPEGDAIKSLAGSYPLSEIKLVELPYSTLREQLVSALGDTKKDFDVIMLDDPWFPQLAGGLANLQAVPNEIASDIVPASLDLGKIPYKTGLVFALPFVGNTQLLFYREDLLKSFGYQELPDNWKQLAEVAKQISETAALQGRDVFGYAIRGRSGAPVVTDFLPIFWSLGGQLVDDRGNPKHVAIDLGILVEALEIYKTLQSASPPGAINFDWSEMTAAFTLGKAVFQLNWPAAISIVESATGAEYGSGVWGVELPPGHDGKSGTSMIGNWLLGIPADSENVNDAEQFIYWLMDKQALVAGTGNPPTRESVFKEMASQPGKAYFATIQQGLNLSTPRVRTHLWAQMEESVSRAVSEYLLDQVSAYEAAMQLSNEISNILGQ